MDDDDFLLLIAAVFALAGVVALLR